MPYVSERNWDGDGEEVRGEGREGVGCNETVCQCRSLCCIVGGATHTMRE